MNMKDENKNIIILFNNYMLNCITVFTHNLSKKILISYNDI